MDMMKRVLWILTVLLVVMLALGRLDRPRHAFAQQPQAPNVSPGIPPIFAVNAEWVNGVAPGYWSTAAATGLTLNISAGTSFCNTSIVTYAGGTLTMTNNTTNYVYLDTTSSCAPASNTSGFSNTTIPVAKVVTSGGNITTISDDRVSFSTATGSSLGTVTSIATTTPISGGTITTTGTLSCPTCVVASSPGAGIAHFAGSTQTVTSSAIVGADMTNNTVTGTQLAVVQTRRTCMIIVGADNGASALVNADLGPQGRQCFVGEGATVVEVTVAGDAGTPNVIPSRNRAGSLADFVSAALATAGSGGIACSNTGGTTGLDGATTCSATLQNTGLNAGDWIDLHSGTAGGTAKRMSISITYTVN